MSGKGLSANGLLHVLLLTVMDTQRGNLDYLFISTTGSRYSFAASASNVLENYGRSTSSPSHGSRNLAGSIATCWLRALFMHLHAHDSAYSRVSLHMPGR